MCKEAGEGGAGAVEDPPTGTVSPGWAPLAHAKGRPEAGGGGPGGAVSSGQSTRYESG